MLAALLLVLQDVALDVKDVRLAEAFAELSKQTGERFDVDMVIRDSRVTVALKGVRALEAAEQICRAHGKARLVAPMHGGPFTIAPATAAGGPAAASGPYWMRLVAARSTKTTDFHGGRSALFVLDAQILWERRSPPAIIRFRVVEAVDDTGASLARETGPDAVRTLGKPAQICGASLQIDHPSHGARKFAKLAIEVDAWTTEAPVEIAIKDLAVGAAGGFATITRSSRAASAWTGALEVKMPKSDDGAPVAPADRLRDIALVDGDKRWPASIVTSLARDGKLNVELVATDVPGDAKPSGLRASWIVKFTKSTLRFAFTDVELP